MLGVLDGVLSDIGHIIDLDVEEGGRAPLPRNKWVQTMHDEWMICRLCVSPSLMFPVG